MKAKVKLDKRAEQDKRYDMLFEKMAREANLNPRQKFIVREYLRGIIHEKIQEVEDAMSIGFWIGLIDIYKFGCNERATRLPKLQNYVREVLNDAYDRDCVDANGVIDYDGCGLIRLKNRLRNYGVKFNGD